MPVEPHRISEALHANLPPADCHQVLKAWAERHGATEIRETSAGLLVRMGSRLKYRLLGAGIGSEQIPLELTFDLSESEQGTDVFVELSSDEGWYLIQTGRRIWRTRTAGRKSWLNWAALRLRAGRI